MQKHEDNSRIAKLSGTSTSIVGASLVIGGGVASFFTLGTSLILTVVGVSLGVAGINLLLLVQN